MLEPHRSLRSVTVPFSFTDFRGSAQRATYVDAKPSIEYCKAQFWALGHDLSDLASTLGLVLLGKSLLCLYDLGMYSAMAGLV